MATQTYDNPERPSEYDYIYNPDQLIAGTFQLVTANVTLKAGSSGQVVKRGTVLGQINTGSAASAAKSGGNTGNGTLTLDVTTPLLANAQSGVYRVRCTAAATDSGTFQVTDPTGDVLGSVVVGATFADQIKFAIADGATDFIVGDGFDITVSGSGKYITSVATAVDGSQVPSAILADDTIITADAIAGVYLTGEFNQNAITKDASWSIAALTPLLRQFSIFLKSVVSAADPT